MKYRPSGGEVSEGVGRELADMSTEIRLTCRPTCRSTVGHSFVCMLISSLCLVNMYKTQKNFELEMRQRGLVNMQIKK